MVIISRRFPITKPIPQEQVFLSVIIPVYNEKDTIGEIVKRVEAVSIRKEIIITDDCSTDGTRNILKEMEREYTAHHEVDPNNRVRFLYHDKNMGKGAALRTGFSNIAPESTVVVVQDADLEYDPNDYEALLKPIADGYADVVYGSRFKGPGRAFMFWHMVANKLLTLLTNILYNTILTDMETCYKMFRSDVIRGVRLRANRFDFEPEITAKILKQKLKVYEVPIHYYGRDYDEGKKIGLKDAFEAVFALIKYRFKD
ncbi:glycosyltransferase family 2 protein [Candidatus Chlorohelix sp.]|uniref:glycosyltransferase family 2 protein n=1 Tax=Candidatus Chlorohelix sp. TaxID=3139201 RepID=UPI00302ED277